MKKCPNAPLRHRKPHRPVWEQLRRKIKRRDITFYTPHDIIELQDKETLERVLNFYNRIGMFVDDVEEMYVCLMRLCLFKRIMEL